MRDLNLYEKKLTALREQVLAVIGLAGDAAQTVELDQNKVGRLSRMDAMQGQAMAQANLARQKAMLTNIDKALMRISQGNYGRCADCDEFIAEQRLAIDPTAELCFGCASDRER